MLILPALWRVMREGHRKFEASLDYLVKSCFIRKLLIMYIIIYSHGFLTDSSILKIEIIKHYRFIYLISLT